MANEDLTFDEFFGSYDPDTQVRVGKGEGLLITLGQALMFESVSCPVYALTKDDEAGRMRYAAGRLDATGNLRPEHQHLLKPPEPEAGR